MAVPKFAVNDRVRRIEDREVVGATVLEVDAESDIFYRIGYDEGGEGWWPEDSLEAE